MTTKGRASRLLVFPVPVPGQGGGLPPSAADLRASLGLRPIALSEMAREGGRHVLAFLSDDEDLLARAGQLASRCGLKVIPGATAPAHAAEVPPPFQGSLVSGPRAGFEKMFEVLLASGDGGEGALAKAGEAALDGPAAREIRCGERVLRAESLDRGGRPLVMGVLNVTPDSFSDGGRYAEPEAAIARGVEMAGEGADVLDVGGESTRPGSEPVSAEEEIRRVLPVVEGLAAKVAIPISVDTTKAEVARRAVAAGAAIINDISGLTLDPAMAALTASLQVPVVLNHIRGVPKTMQESPRFDHVVLEVLLDLAAKVDGARRAGVAAARIVVDPGIGFGKRVEDNLAILRHLRVFRALGCPVLVGVSRKSFLGALSGREVGRRLPATLAAETFAALAGAEILRTHEPGAALDALKVARALGGSLVSR